MHLVYNTKSEASALESRLAIALGLPKGTTVKYGNVIKHVSDSKWALVINNGAENHLTEEEKNNQVILTSDWFPADPTL